MAKAKSKKFKMGFVAFGRSIKAGLLNFWRNIWLSTAATLIMLITLIILTITALVVSVSSYAIHNVQEKVDVSIYFNTQATDSQISQVQDQIQNLPQVASVQYISAEQGLDQFKQAHVNDPTIMKSLSELNSNPIPATLEVKAKQLNEYDSIVQFAQQSQFQPYISKIDYQDNRQIIQRLSSILSTLRKSGIILAIIFAFLAILVIFNTIRLTIYNRREEVEIMRLVGATNWYIRWPFIIESIIYAVIAVVITSAIFIPALHYLVPNINNYLAAGTDVPFRFLNLWVLFAGELVVALILGIISSLIAIRRYLRI